MYYIRATGDNRYGHGTTKWLKIRSIEEISDSQCEIGTIINGQEMFTIVNPKNRIEYWEFAKGWPNLEPIGFFTILKEMEKVHGLNLEAGSLKQAI